MDNFSDGLIQYGKEKNSRVMLEIAPNMGRIPGEMRERFQSAGAVLFSYGVSLIEKIGERLAGVVLDKAAYELYGVDGVMAMTMTAKLCHGKKLPVIVDGCFGGQATGLADLAAAYFSSEGDPNDQRFYADAFTVSPYCSADAIRALATGCLEDGKGAFVYVRTTPSADKTHFENIKDKEDECIFKAAADDSGAFGENYIGENGYSVLGMITCSTKDNLSIRSMNRWGLALVCATLSDLDEKYTYGFFYPGEAEGEFVVLSDREISSLCAMGSAESFLEDYGKYVEQAVTKVEKARLAK